MARRDTRRFPVPAAVLALTLALAAPAASAADEPNGATIQWAQDILDKQSFYNGPLHSRMDAATSAAVMAYQRKNGLKATGRLDQATIAKMMEGREPDKTVGNLADPKSRAKSSSPMVREQDVRPQAAPVAPSVERAGGGETGSTVVMGGPAPAGGTTVPQASPAARVEGASGEALPSAAPRAGVEAEGGAEPASDEPFRLEAPNWVRTGLIGLVAAIVLGMAAAWWLSGVRRGPKRKPAKGAARAAAPATGGRREPSLGGAAPGPDGRRAPTLSAAPRGDYGGGTGGLRAGR